MHPRRTPTLALAILTVLVTPSALAQADIQTYADAAYDTTPRGGLQDGYCGVDNVGTEPLMVQLSADVTYADGRGQVVLRSDSPVTLAPGFGYHVFVLFEIPPDAAPGAAVFTCAFRAFSAPGGTLAETPRDGFQVVA